MKSNFILHNFLFEKYLFSRTYIKCSYYQRCKLKSLRDRTFLNSNYHPNPPFHKPLPKFWDFSFLNVTSFFGVWDSWASFVNKLKFRLIGACVDFRLRITARSSSVMSVGKRISPLKWTGFRFSRHCKRNNFFQNIYVIIKI